MNTEQFIAEAAERNWSKQMTREALGVPVEKFEVMLTLIPNLKWPGPGKSLGHQLAYEARRGVDTQHLSEARARGRVKRREQASYSVNGLTGTIEELVKHFTVSPSTVRRRMNSGMTIEQALTLPPTPVSQRRSGLQVITTH